MGHHPGGKALEVFPDIPDSPLLPDAVSPKRLINGDPRIDPFVGVRPESLGIRGVFPAEFLVPFLCLCRDAISRSRPISPAAIIQVALISLYMPRPSYLLASTVIQGFVG